MYVGGPNGCTSHVYCTTRGTPSVPVFFQVVSIEEVRWACMPTPLQPLVWDSSGATDCGLGDLRCKVRSRRKHVCLNRLPR